LENDSNSLYTQGGKITGIPTPVPPSTALVDAAIDLFSQMVLDQPMKIQESAFTHIAARLGDPSLGRNAGRKAAVTMNVVLALSKALSKLTNRSFKDANYSERVTSSILDVLHVPCSLILIDYRHVSWTKILQYASSPQIP
jgi:HEAT repeat-containing protein 5